jgi:hypothetical protein
MREIVHAHRDLEEGCDAQRLVPALVVLHVAGAGQPLSDVPQRVAGDAEVLAVRDLVAFLEVAVQRASLPPALGTVNPPALGGSEESQ